MINVSGINHIGYLTTLQIYLDTLIRLTQKPTSTHVSSSAIKNSCVGKKSDEEEQVPEIIAPSEQTPKPQNPKTPSKYIRAISLKCLELATLTCVSSVLRRLLPLLGDS
jgi:hypothetical protein